MATDSKTFSESWYRVAELRLALRPQVKVHRQYYRGEKWFVLQDPFNNQFFRLRQPAYEFVSRLDGKHTVGKAWEECLEINPDNAPGQTEAIQLLAQLFGANLIFSDVPADAAKLFKRFQKRRQREIRGRALSFMFFRIPLVDPDPFLRRTLPFFQHVFSKWGAVVWFFVVAWALKLVAENFDALVAQGRTVLEFQNLPLLYAGLVVVKVLHEFGHGYLCRKYGGELHTLGVIFLIFTPIPYVDATSSWSFRNRWHRVLVGLGGMIVELFVAALATFIWVATGPGVLNSFAFNMMFVASVSTILFNANPLLRFDGYYIFSDLLNVPNLYTRGQQQLKYLFKRYGCGQKRVKSSAHNAEENFWLPFYGISSLIYRIFVFSMILLFVADQFLLAGILMAFFCFIAWVVVPTGKFVHYIASSPELERCRPRAIAVALLVVGGPVLFLQTFPFSHGFRAPGMVHAREHTLALTQTPGYVKEILAQPGAWVEEGDPLVRLANPELSWELARAEAQMVEAEARIRSLLQEGSRGIEAAESYRDAIRQQVRSLREEDANLLLRARHAGVWNIADGGEFEGMWFPRGRVVGAVIDHRAFEFIAVISQQEASRLFSDEIRGGAVRIAGQGEETLSVNSFRVQPGERRRLPSASLGWRGGGEISVAAHDQAGLETEEPFFEVRGDLGNPPDEVALFHGQSGRMRFELDPSPLLPRWIRSFFQLLQDRYGI